MGTQLEPANHHGVRRPIGREPSLLRLFLSLTFLVNFIPRMSASSRPRSADILRQNARRQRVVCSSDRRSLILRSLTIKWWVMLFEGRQTDQPILPDGQITSDFQKSCQAPKSKIFLFSFYPNQMHILRRPVPEEGRCARHQRGAGCGGRWQRARRTRIAGVRPSRVVLAPQCRRQVCEKKRRRRCQTSLVTGESAK